MSEHNDFTPETGRKIVLDPVAPGMWLVIGGAVIAVIGPLFGFLAGSMKGVADGGDLNPIYLFLFAGIAIGGIGTAMVVMGLWKIVRGLRHSDAP